MSVYVDPQFTWPASSTWPFTCASHLVADTEIELHEFAEKIGLQKGWFQERVGMPHYDLTSGKRRQAVAAGAREISARELVVMIHAREVKERACRKQ